MATDDLVCQLGEPVNDADEETFLLYSSPIPSSNLGFVDAKARSLTLSLAFSRRDITIHQSPSLLSSTRAGGTTGAVLWKISPLFSQWLATAPLPFTRSSTVLELGCGISPLNGLAVAPLVSSYILSDQAYVRKLLAANLDENPVGNLYFRPLDWESDAVTEALAAPGTFFDVVLACDCVYNEALVPPFVDTCADACRLKEAQGQGKAVCVVAQQLRDDGVFREWLSAFMERFTVWRVPEDLAGDMKDGFVLHVGVLHDR